MGDEIFKSLRGEMLFDICVMVLICSAGILFFRAAGNGHVSEEMTSLCSDCS